MFATQHFSHITGTLNTVLANKNGIVIAADSRATWRDSGTVHHDDGFQKLFRTGKSSAMAIAGLLATPPEPYSVETASTILARFGTKGIDDERGTPFLVTKWVELHLGIHLRRLAAVLSTSMQVPKDCHLIATIAGYDKANTPQISQIDFLPSSAATVVNGKPVWMITPTVALPITVSGFVYRTAGVTRVADAILSGHFAESKPAVVTYLKASENGAVEKLAVNELVALTETIFEETIAQENAVGGELQMAVIPAGGEAQWRLKVAAEPNIRLGGAELVIGGVNPLCGTNGEMPAHHEFVQNFDTLNADRLYVATRFNDLVIPLDENQFFGCTFEHCTFAYSGSQRVAFDWNMVVDCQLEIGNPNAPIPSQVRQLQADCPPADDNARARPRIPR